jgi:hypothetical protein
MDEGESELDRSCVGKISEPGLTGIQLALGPIGFADERLLYLDIAQLNPDRLVVFPTVFDVGLNDPLLIDHFLEIMGQKIVKGVKLVARNMLP